MTAISSTLSLEPWRPLRRAGVDRTSSRHCHRGPRVRIPVRPSADSPPRPRGARQGGHAAGHRRPRRSEQRQRQRRKPFARREPRGAHAALHGALFPFVGRRPGALRPRRIHLLDRSLRAPGRPRSERHRVVVRFLNTSGKEDGISMRLLYPSSGWMASRPTSSRGRCRNTAAVRNRGREVWCRAAHSVDCSPLPHSVKAIGGPLG